MLSHGDYVDGRTRLVEDAALLFWGEWEPPSHVEDLTESGDGRRPRWLHRPYLPGRMPAQPKNRGAACSTPPGCGSTCGPGGVCQNTDPYVFDGEFKYLLCKQSTHRGKRATDMARLDVGSVILFGSNARVSGKWVFELDTVLVVGSHTDYRPSQWSRDLSPPIVSTHYHEVVVKQAFGESTRIHPINQRLYRGATWQTPTNGMYSFAPAKPYDGQTVGFARVILRQSDLPAISPPHALLKDNNNMAPRCTAISDQIAQAAWRRIRDICRKQGFVEAVRFDTPGTSGGSLGRISMTPKTPRSTGRISAHL